MPETPAPVAPLSPWRTIAEHATSFLSVTYLLAAGAGTTYHFFLYRAFDLSVFHYWDLEDYLVSAIREPRILMFVVLAVLIASAVIWAVEWDEWARARGRLVHLMFGNYLWNKLGFSVRNSPWFGCLLGTVFFFVLTHDLAEKREEALHDGRRDVVEVHAPILPGGHMDGVMISRTSAFLLFFDRRDGGRYVVPLESLEGLYFPGDRPPESAEGSTDGTAAPGEASEASRIPEVSPSSTDPDKRGAAMQGG